MTSEDTLVDEQAERAVLGAMMLSEEAADQILETGLAAGHFYRPGHSLLYAMITATLASREPCDPVSLTVRLTEAGEIVRVGGAPYLHTLVSTVPTAANGAWYAVKVRELGARRRMLEAAARIDQIARDRGRNIADAADLAQAEIHNATAIDSQDTIQSLADLADTVLEEVLAPGGPDRGLSTGLGSLDDVIGGLRPGQLVIIGGRPGAGKSVVSVDMARTAAIRRGLPTALYSLEMTKTEIVKRIYAAEASVNLTRILHGGLHYDETARLREYAPYVRKAPLHIEDTAPMTIGQIRTSARRMQQRHGLRLLVVDYIQLVRSNASRDSRVQEVGEVSAGLKMLAKELGVPVVAACQVNRSSEARQDKRPALSDLRESGSLEQDADVVILLHRPDYHDPEHARAGEIDLIVAKNRHGATETVTCAAQLDKARVVDFETRNSA